MQSGYRAVSHESRMAGPLTRTNTLRMQQLEGQNRALMPPPVTTAWPIASSIPPSLDDIPSSPHNSIVSLTQRSVDDQLQEETRSNASATSSASRLSKRKRSQRNLRKAFVQRENELRNQERELQIELEKEKLEERRLKRRREELELREMELELDIRRKAAGL